MSRSTTGRLVGFFTLLLLLCIRRNRKQANSLQDTANRQQPKFILEYTNPDIEHPSEQQHRSNQETQWARENTISRAQKTLAFITTIATICALVFAGLTYSSTLDVVRYTRDQAYQAARQAEAAEQGAPRAWLYIQFEDHDPVMETKPIENGAVNIWITVPFTIHNFGALPARIDSVDARMIIPADASFPDKPPTNIDDVGKHFISGGIEVPDVTFSQVIGHVILANDAKPILFMPPDFFFHNRPNMARHTFPSQWIYIKVIYRDPYGTRTSCVYAKARFDFALVPNSKYNDCR